MKEYKYITEWADLAFPDREDAFILLKMFEEIGEFVKHPHPWEAADIFILLIDICNRKGIDLGKAVQEKMIVNMQRKWVVNKHTGVMQHVDEGKD